MVAVGDEVGNFVGVDVPVTENVAVGGTGVTPPQEVNRIDTTMNMANFLFMLPPITPVASV
jgi:hypothetical protein